MDSFNSYVKQINTKRYTDYKITYLFLVLTVNIED